MSPTTGPTSPVQPPHWSDEQLTAELTKAIDAFREVRMQEPLEDFLQIADNYTSVIEDLIEDSIDLTALEERALGYITDPAKFIVLRYLVSPPISEDDLETLVRSKFSGKALSSDPAAVHRIVDTILLGLDRNRFPWVHEQRESTDEERRFAAMSTAGLIGARRVMTDRANQAKTNQEAAVAYRLLAEGFVEVPTRTISNFGDAPATGEFCGESHFGTRKADLVIGLWNGRKMPLECKVSGSATNSVKRLNNDAAVKAKTWIREFGTQSVVPAAMLGGVFKLKNLRNAQDDGLALFWVHALDAFASWVASTRP